MTGSEFLLECEIKRSKISDRKVQQPQARFDFSVYDLPDGWVWSSISEVSERVSVGHVGPTSEYFCSADTGVPLIRSQDVKPGKLHLRSVAHVTREFHKKLKKSKLQAGDILIVRVGANRGDCCLVPEGVTELNCANIVFARPLIPSKYFAYYFQTPFGRETLLSVTTGSAQGVINTTAVARMPVPVPPKAVQLEISEILENYDNLIENNNRRIAILEEMAQSLYREWFVKFRFPGHDQCQMVESPLGLIPEGWEVKPLHDLTCYLNRGIAPKYSDDADQFVINQRCIRNFKLTLNNVRGNIKKVPEDKIIQYGDVLVNSTGVGTLGRVAQVLIHDKNLTVDTHVTILRPSNNINVEFWGTCLELLQPHFQRLGEGATGQTELKRQLIGETKIVVPSLLLRDQFSTITQPMKKQIQTLLTKNENLKKQRNLLLPKLIRGQIDLSQAEQASA